MATRDEQTERRIRILQLRAKGLTARAIAERTGYSWGYVRNVLCAARKRHAERLVCA
jgi:DNA-binding NarL/FixJ family response regulator